MQEGTASGPSTKTCPMCAEDIPLDAETCEYCGARFGVVRTGYCAECHAVGAVAADGNCAQCGKPATDVRVESRHLGGEPKAAPAAQPAPPPPPPPPAPVAPPPQPYAAAPVPAPVAPPQPFAPQAQYPPPAPQPYPPQQYAPPQPYQQPYQQPYPQQPYGAPAAAPAQWTYQSGMGSLSVVPPEARGWNWGAFFLTFIWGIGNNTWISLLSLIPYVNFVMVFVLGAKGNEWAWRNKHWDSVEQFRRAQRNWAVVGLVLFLIGLVLAIVGGVASGIMEASRQPSTTTF